MDYGLWTAQQGTKKGICPAASPTGPALNQMPCNVFYQDNEGRFIGRVSIAPFSTPRCTSYIQAQINCI